MNEYIKKAHRENIAIAIAGVSGRGKTYSIRNLNPKSTIFINLEKIPSFNHKKYLVPQKLNLEKATEEELEKLEKDSKTITRLERRYYTSENLFNNCSNVELFMKSLEFIIEHHNMECSEVDTIVIDSFTAALSEINKYCNNRFINFEIWSSYNKYVEKFFEIISKFKGCVLVIAHHAIDSDIDSVPSKFIEVAGRKNRTNIERNFTIVLTAEVEPQLEGRPKYQLSLIPNRDTAKCPCDIFGEEVTRVDNDMEPVLKKIKDFYYGVEPSIETN